ncbi:thiamine-phosphate kinase [Sphingomonas pseudosanguinis]|uniref:Thiamine-monophosphate kinase n=1 Tax=Sphingomonas pseudosanguinis TaxID=413712 RepID=A0A7W6F1K8_9SPHN|nr:thiamine-phosphate kinase [Sphingomonas pseudosanguinis]MBB3877812.1 thiamine-monophosphate kinase [Sphingomonas pseudosanguinis]MBN3537687.1 thiamine-phosphate kinase [Sphingomonas pseudosanguinis]
MTEAEFIAALRRMPLHPGAHGLMDDSAVIDAGPLVVTTDTLVEGVHFLPQDPPGDVAWKLVATNLSDLAAKGALVEGVLLNYPLGDSAWDHAFLDGLSLALARFDARLIGGDTVSLRGPRVLTLTAFGREAAAPVRSGARAGDALWVTGTIGDAGLGLAIAMGGTGPEALRDAYRRPQPRLTEGRALAPVVHAMMDVSDGLLIDAARMAQASGLAVTIDLDAVRLSPAARALGGEDRAARLAAATAGDDYELLFALPPDVTPPVAATRVGRFDAGAGLSLFDTAGPIPLPPRLGFEHAAPR